MFPFGLPKGMSSMNMSSSPSGETVGLGQYVSQPLQNAPHPVSSLSPYISGVTPQDLQLPYGARSDIPYQDNQQMDSGSQQDLSALHGFTGFHPSEKSLESYFSQNNAFQPRYMAQDTVWQAGQPGMFDTLPNAPEQANLQVGTVIRQLQRKMAEPMGQLSQAPGEAVNQQISKPFTPNESITGGQRINAGQQLNAQQLMAAAAQQIKATQNMSAGQNDAAGAWGMSGGQQMLESRQLRIAGATQFSDAQAFPGVQQSPQDESQIFLGVSPGHLQYPRAQQQRFPGQWRVPSVQQQDFQATWMSHEQSQPPNFLPNNELFSAQHMHGAQQIGTRSAVQRPVAPSLLGGVIGQQNQQNIALQVHAAREAHAPSRGAVEDRGSTGGVDMVRLFL